MKDWWLTVRAGRRLQLARYWQARSELDEAAVHAYHAGRLLTGRPPSIVASDVAVTTAQIERDRARYSDSERHFEHAVDQLNALAPGDDRDRRLGNVHIGLADLHRRAGRYPEAAAALTAARTALGRDDVAQAMLRGVIAKEQGRFDEAAQHYHEVERMGLSQSETATLHHNLAGLANAQQLYQRAETHARQSVELRRADPRASAVEVAQDVAVLASAVAGQGRTDEARRLFGEALATCRAARPVRDYEVAVHLHNLASIEQDCGDVAAAEQFYRQALDIKVRLLGADHPEVALVTHNLATLLRDAGRIAEATDHFRRALAIAERALPPEHPLVQAARTNLL